MPELRIQCDLCGGDTAHDDVLAVGTRRPVPDMITRCRVCGYVHLSPLPDVAEIRAYYDTAPTYGLTSDDPRDYAGIVADKRAFIEWIFRVAERPANRHSLDVGCGIGALVQAMRSSGFEARGIDYQDAAARQGAKIFGVTIENKDITEIADASQGVVSMCDCLEHFPHPLEALAEVRRILDHGGVFFGTIPNFNGLERYLKGADAAVVSYPQHLSFFTVATLRRALEKAGFEVCFCGFIPLYAVALSLGLRRRLRAARASVRFWGAARILDGVVSGLTWSKRWLLYPVLNAFVVEPVCWGIPWCSWRARRPE